MDNNQAVVVYGGSSRRSGEGSTRKPPENLHRGTVLMVLLLGAFVTILNQTLLNVAIPHLMNDFNVSADTVQWLSTGYMLINGILIPITAFLIGTFSTRQLFISAMLSFTIGSFICSLAPNFSVMMVGRLIQGCGAGIIMPLMMTVILNIFPPEVRGKAMGMIGIAMFFAPAVGPTLSGWILQHWSWRLLFYVAIPIAIVDIILAVAFLKNVTKQTYPKFDLWGFVTSTIGFGTLLYGCSEAGSQGWGSAEVVISLLIGAVFLILFVIRELTTENPMLNLKVFRYDIFSLSTVVSCIVSMAMFGGALLLPIYLQNIRGYTALDSGLLMLPGALLMGVMSPVSGALFDRFGARPLAIVGLAITAVTTWEFTKLNGDTTYGTLMLLYTLRMFGMSFISMTIMTAGLNQLPREMAAHGTAASNTMRQVASSIGTAVLVTVMTTRMNYHMGQFRDTLSALNPNLHVNLQGLGQAFAHELGQSVQVGTAAAVQLMNGLAMQEAAIQGINDAFVVATGLTILALAVSFFLRRAGHSRMKQKRTPSVKTAKSRAEVRA